MKNIKLTNDQASTLTMYLLSMTWIIDRHLSSIPAMSLI